MTFNIFEAIEEVQGILNKLDEEFSSLFERIDQSTRYRAAVKVEEPRKKEYEKIQKKYYNKPIERRTSDEHKKFITAQNRYLQAKNLANSRGYGGSIVGSSDSVEEDPKHNSRTYTREITYEPATRKSAVGHSWTEDMGTYEETLNKNAQKRANKKLEESFLSQVLSLKEEFSSLFEGSQKEVNKIKRTKTHTDSNEPTEVVSVADELFPREGNAKQQYNQKVLDIINGMIEGSNTLDDLIRFVRRKDRSVKESLEENISLMKGLLEQLEEISEVSTKFTGNIFAKVEDKIEALDKAEQEEKDPEKKEEIKTEKVKLQHKLNPTISHATNYHIKQIETEKKNK